MKTLNIILLTVLGVLIQTVYFQSKDQEIMHMWNSYEEISECNKQEIIAEELLLTMDMLTNWPAPKGIIPPMKPGELK